jgi:excisionase family DNA binding protein
MQTIAPTPNKPSFPPKLAYSIAEACVALSLGRTTIFGLIRRGELRVVRIGNRTLVTADALRALLNAEATQ